MPIDDDKIPKLKDIVAPRKSFPLILPVVVLIMYMSRGYTATMAGFAAVVTAVIVYLLFSASWSDVKVRARKLISALEEGGKSVVQVATLVAAAQIVVTIINATGIGVKFSQVVSSLSGQSVFMALLLAMVVLIILGMGVPTVAAYILGAAVTAPALSSMGIPILNAHMFIFYFAIISAITPPVCSSVYVAAAIAKADWLKTGFIACRLGIAGFVVPFMFIYRPEILLQGTVIGIIYATAVCTLALTCWAAVFTGYFRRALFIWEKVILFVVGFLLIFPAVWADILGFLLFGGFVLMHYKDKIFKKFNNLSIQ